MNWPPSCALRQEIDDESLLLRPTTLRHGLFSEHGDFNIILCIILQYYSLSLNLRTSIKMLMLCDLREWNGNASFTCHCECSSPHVQLGLRYD